MKSEVLQSACNVSAKKVKRIFVYTEAAPVHRDVVAHGLNRAGTPILRAISDHIDGIAIYPVEQWYASRDLDKELAPLCSSLPYLPTVLCRAFRRYPSFDVDVENALPPLLFARKVSKSQADILFAFVGADVGTLTRVSRLARLSAKPYAFYFVDDILSPVRIWNDAKMRGVRERARVAIRGATHVFAITDGLGEHLRQHYGVSSTTLPLVFDLEPRPDVRTKQQILFLGSINFLYSDGLRDLIQVVDQVRRSGEIDLTIRLTVPTPVAARELGVLPSFVTAAPVGTSEELAREIASSLFAFLPCSFSPAEETMVRTSFPSKSMEYFAYARSIVVYGPEYGAAPKLFRDASMPQVASSIGELAEAVNIHLFLQPDHSRVYRKHLAAEHSANVVRKTICQKLGIESS